MHARTQIHSVMIISTLVTTFLLRCIYLRFLDSMFRFELWGRVRKTWQTATELDRPSQTLGWRLVTSRPATDKLQVVLSSVTFCHVLLRSPRSTMAHLSRSIPPWLPWQIFWLFKNLSRRSRRATFVDPVPPTLCYGHPVSSTVAEIVTAVATGDIV